MTAYTSSGAIQAQGCLLAIGGVNVGEVINFKGPGGTTPIFDISNLQSLAKEKKAGLADEGTIAMSLNLVPGDAGQIAARNARSARANSAFSLTLSDKGTTSPTTLTFNGYVTVFSIDGAVGKQVMASITIDITGAVTWTAAV